ncbi:MAG: hypothetical protein ACREA0_32800, partial [bacterium]
GKNRVYLNGGLCPAGFLAEVGGALIHIYGQHEHHTLLKSDSHLALLDAYGGLEEKVEAMGKRYQAFRDARERLMQGRELIERCKREEELLRAQVEEIAAAGLKAGEEEDLKTKRNTLIHAEKLYQGCKEGEEILYEGEAALVSRLGRYVPRLRELANIDGSLKEAVELLNSSLVQLEEAASLLRDYANRVEFDPAALEHMEDRIAEIGRLKKKYHSSVEEILQIQTKVEGELRALERGVEELPDLEREFEQARGVAWREAEALSSERIRIAKKFKKEMEKEVHALGMPGTIFEARFLDAGELEDDPPFVVGGRRMSEQGTDRVEFHISPNPGEAVKPLAKIVSGGELS